MLLNELPAANAVKFGSLYYKPKELDSVISRSCRMVLLEANDQELPLGRSGSSTLIRFKGRKFVVLTRHQLGINPNEVPSSELLDTIRIVSGHEQLKNIPLSKCIFESSNPDQEYHDLLFFEVSEAWVDQNLDAPFFIPVTSFSSEKRKLSRLFGCPFLPVVMGEYLETFEFGKIGTIHMKTVVSECLVDESYVSKAKYFRRFTGGPKNNELDGFSGGPVLSLIGDINNLEMVLDGIVVRAGNSQIYIVDSDYIALVLDANISA